ncbi:probable polygalacturonase At1g80170 isoform X2 [Momordica charantia]|uniref:endo-polygalacturonase n=1 Tax=Momordica charantia TaxID=3673 RepID=A0A6J1DK85_MOMCH|nr:probable polygalacturonase At1g80170 isoform X2 [Momordica charantia]
MPRSQRKRFWLFADMKGQGSQPFPLPIFVFIVFTSFSFESTAEFDSLLQLPLSGSNATRPKSKRVFDLRDFGAKGDGFSNDTQALLAAWKMACSFPTRTRVVFPASNTFLVHPIELHGPCRSRLTLRIYGTINAPKDPDAWAGRNPRKWLYFRGVNHLTLEGGGEINGMGYEWWMRSCKINSTNPCRHAPTAMTFHKCKNLKIRHLLVIDSQQMHVSFTNCLRVVASDLKVIAPAFSPNTDGIHISASRGVTVTNSIISTGDDCISIVSNSSRVLIRNIACGPGHGISIGSLGKQNTWAQVRNVMVDGAVLSNTKNGVRIKTWQGGSGFATDITFKNILMKNVSNPIIIDQYYCDSDLPCANQTSAVKVGDISFIHIKGTAATKEAIKFACSDTSPCEDLFLEDILLLSNDGDILTSLCWQAQGSNSGPVYPPSCFLSNENFIEQVVQPDPVSHSF